MTGEDREWWRGYLQWGEETAPSPDPPHGYFLVYDAHGQRGHVWVDDIEEARVANPGWRYEPSKVVARAESRARGEGADDG